MIALSLAGAAIVAVILLSGGDDSGKSTTTEVEQPETDITPGPDEPGRRARVRATPGWQYDSTRGKAEGPRDAGPGTFTAGVVERGQLPPAVQAKLGGALDDGSLTLASCAERRPSSPA